MVLYVCMYVYSISSSSPCFEKILPNTLQQEKIYWILFENAEIGYERSPAQSRIGGGMNTRFFCARDIIPQPRNKRLITLGIAARKKRQLEARSARQDRREEPLSARIFWRTYQNETPNAMNETLYKARKSTTNQLKQKNSSYPAADPG